MRPIFLAFLAFMALPAAAQDTTQEAAETAAIAASDADAEGAEATDEAATEPPAEPPVEAIDPAAPRNAVGLTLEEFLWVARPIIVFADSPADPRFAEQMQLLAERPEPLLERDVVILYDTDPSARSEIRTALRPRGFSIVIIAKDGAVGMRRPSVRDVRELVRVIDNFQFRQEELRTGQ